MQSLAGSTLKKEAHVTIAVSTAIVFVAMCLIVLSLIGLGMYVKKRRTSEQMVNISLPIATTSTNGNYK